jgi:signal transduction histidine kinase
LEPLPGVLVGATLAVEVGAVVLSWGLEPRYDTLLYAVYSVTQVGAGAIVASRLPSNPIGWLLCFFGLWNALSADLAQGWALRADDAGWTGVAAGEWIAAPNWLFGALGLTLMFLLFPDGRLPGRRWRWAAWAAAAGLALALPAYQLTPVSDDAFSSGRNPVVVAGLPGDAMLDVGMALLLGAMVAAALALVARFRRSRGVERQQLKWFAFAAAVAGVTLPLSAVLWYETPVVRPFAALALTALPVAACIAMLRYRLYDIDVVVNRTVVYATLTVLLAAAFAATALLLGTALGRGSAWTTAGATLVAAAAFRPLRARVQDAVDRRFNRARYDARRRMADFLEELRGGRAAPEDVEPILRELLSDARLKLLLHITDTDTYVDVRGQPVQAAPDHGRAAVPIERNGRPLAVVVYDDALQAERPRLLRTLVADAGLAIEITRLRVELRQQLAEVQASRARIVAAANAERRRIERDLHDGAQQRLVAIGLALRHAQHQLTSSTPGRAGETLDGAVAEIEVALDELRELAHGLPPAQLDAGLAPAFRELARRAPMPVDTRVAPERFAAGVEAAAYFIACEAVTNAVKHARATRIALSAGRENAQLVVRVADDGVGGAAPAAGSGLSGLGDRVAALGGTLHIDSDPGAGTTLVAKLPCAS